METQVKRTPYSIENFVGRRFKFKHDVLFIERWATSQDRYFINIGEPTHGSAMVDSITRLGIHWHAWLLDKRVTGFISFKAIQDGLIEEKIS